LKFSINVSSFKLLYIWDGDYKMYDNDVKLLYYSKLFFLHNCSNKITLMIMSQKIKLII